MPSLMLTPVPPCIHQHTPCGLLAPNSTSPALPCLPLVHRNPSPYPLTSTKICFSFFFFIFPLHFKPLQHNVATVVPCAHLGHHRNHCHCTCAGPIACTTY